MVESKKIIAKVLIALLLTMCAFLNVANSQPQEGVSCVVSAGNRNAPLAIDGSYFISGIPGNMGAIRARAICSDGSFGQSEIGFTDATQLITIPLGPIQFGVMDPVPIAVNLHASESQLRTGEISQLTLTAVALDGTTRDVTSRSEGTVYSISNDLLATVSEDGLVNVTAQFDTSSSARVVASATTEGSVSSTYMYHLGPLGKLTGTVYKADGITPVLGAQVSVLRLQPRESAGFVFTDVNGRFVLENVNAGSFVVNVLEPNTGDRALANAQITTQGEIVDVSLILNGLGTVNVTVVNDNNEIVSGADVTLTSLGAYTTSKVLTTNTQGVVNFDNVAVGDFSVSTRDQVTGLLGAIVSEITDGQTIDLTLVLQETGAIHGLAFDTDGTTLLSNIQVRLSSRQRGIISQMVTTNGGAFAFDTLPKMDGPFILDAFVDGRLRARVPGIVYSQGDEDIERNIILSAVGTVSGVVKDESSSVFANARVQMQSLEGLRLTFDAYTNQSGVFVLPAVPVGDFELTATTQGGQTARATGRIDTDGQLVVVNLVVAGNTIVGTVYERGGITHVGAGKVVYLALRSQGQHYSYSNSQDVLIAQTDTNGRYGFQITQAGDYYVQAEDGLDRGRSRAILVTLDPSQPLETDVTFLAKGSVSGVVTSANGVLQNNTEVTIFTEGAFAVTRDVMTNANGEYSLDGIFAGNIVVKAINTTTQQSGVRISRLDEEGQSVVVNVVLSATGTVHGEIFKANGVAESGPLNIKVYSNNHLFSEFGNSSGTYEVFNVPLGEVKVTAEVNSSADKGKATTRIDFLNEEKVLDVHLVGQGRLDVELLDTNNNPVVGATITATTSLPLRSTQELVSDAAGKVIFERIYAGDFVINALKEQNFGRLQGSYQATMLADAQQQTTIVMTAVAVGKIDGTVYKPDGITPQGSGWAVRMLPEPYVDAYVTATDADGHYSFDPVNAGTYTVDVYEFYDRLQCPSRGRILGRASNVSLANQGQEVIADIQFLGAGEVFGLITDANNNPQADIKITLTSPDPIYGFNSTCNGLTTYEVSTNLQGNYRFEDIPAGGFTLIAENQSKTFRAEGNGRINFDTDEAEVNLTLIDNVITLPYSFYDANGFLTDISGNGSLTAGTQNVFAAAAPDNGAMRLEIVSNNIPVPFANGNGTLGRLRLDGQEIAIDDTTASGLFVTRRIFTPRSGYFTRYLEVLENPTNQAITVDVKIKSHHREDDSNPRVVDTSDGDQVLSVINQGAPDRWLIVDDQTDADPFENDSIPAIGHVFDGENAQIQASLAQYELIGQTGKLTYQWGDVTVEPGQKIILMHFVFGQIKRTGARAAALRLEGLPPEAIDDLNTEEKNAILNFSIPENSSLDALPNLSAGQISGKVLSGDGFTSVPGAKVIFKSQHDLFGRIRYTLSDENGNYEYQSTLDGTINNYVIPVYGYNIYAEYQRSGVQTTITPASFDSGSTDVQDLIFIGAGDIRGTVLRHNNAIVAGAKVELCDINNMLHCNRKNSAISNADGSYTMFVNTPNNYYLIANKGHPQGYENGRREIKGDSLVTVTAADVTIADIVMEETGSISGLVKSSQGVPISEAEVDLSWLNEGNRIRRTTTDTTGFYRFFDVPLGQVFMTARDEISNAQGQASGVVELDSETTRNIVLENDAILNITIKHERGINANNARVNFVGEPGGLYTDTQGLVQYFLPQGQYEFFAEHPDNSFLQIVFSVEITSGTSEVNMTVTLPGAGEIYGTIVRPDGTTLAGGFPFTITQIRGANPWSDSGSRTDDLGMYQYKGIPKGDYIITAFDAELDRFADAEFSITQDGQEVQIDMILLDDRIALPANLLDANRFMFDVQQNGSLLHGSSAFSQGGGSKLLINNELFTGNTSARLQAGKRQFAITQDTLLSGLNVTRKIYVPRGAYFARYIEILENNSASDINVNISLQSQYAVGEFLNTSSGDNHLDANDLWYVVDDGLDEDILMYGLQMPALANIFANEESLIKPSIINLNYIDSKANVEQIWQQIVVPANSRVSLMHISIQQINRLGANESISRLSQLPPELLTDLTLSDRLTIINFNIPDEGVNTIEPLPLLTGSINGEVLEASESVNVPGTRVTIQSSHPIFSRVWGYKPDPIGCPWPGTIISNSVSNSIARTNFAPDGTTPLNTTFNIQGQLTDTDSIALPVGFNVHLAAQKPKGCYSFFSGHPFTNKASRAIDVEVPIVQNLIFDTTILTGTVIGSNDYSITNGRAYRSIDFLGSFKRKYVNISSDGTFTYPGLVSGVYDFIFDSSHPDKYGSDILRGEHKNVNISINDIIVSDIQMQPTGSIHGSVVAYDGSFVENVKIKIIGDQNNQLYDQCSVGCVSNAHPTNKGKRDVGRRVFTDSLGLFNLSAVPVGTYTMTVKDPVTEAISSYELTVNENQTTIQNTTLTAVGSASVTVLDLLGNPVADAIVHIYSEVVGVEKIAGRTSVAGQLVVANIPIGGYTIRVEDVRFPSFRVMDVSVTDTIDSPNQSKQHELIFKAAASINLKVVNSDTGLNVESSPIRIIDSNGSRNLGVTNNLGELFIEFVPQGPYKITASTTVNGIFREASIEGEILAVDDNTQMNATIDLRFAGVNINFHVLNSDNTPFNNQIRLKIYESGSNLVLLSTLTNSQGEYTYTYFGAEELFVTVKHPTNSQIVASQFIQPAEGQTVDVNLVLASANVQGVLYEHDGVTIVPNVSVIAYYTHNNKPIKSSTTNEQGQYSIALPINNDIMLQARDPSNRVYTQSPQITVGAVDITHDFLLDAVGTIYGRLSGVTDVPIPNARITARYQNNALGNSSQTSVRTTTDANGDYSFDQIPLNQNILIEYSEYRSSGELSVSGNATLVNAGDSAEVNLFIDGAAISIQLSTADGLPINGECNIFLTGANGGGIGGLINKNPEVITGGGFYDIELYNVDCNNRFVFAGIDLTNGSEYKLIVENWSENLGFTQTYTLIADDLLVVNHIYSVVKGAVTFFDGIIVDGAQMTINSESFSSDSQGIYRKVDIGVGLLNIKAEDTATSLQKTVEAQLLNNTTPLVVDIQLPASATINGQVLNEGGLPFDNITVYADSSNSTTVLQNNTDVNGNYNLSHVIAGDVEISAIDPTTNNVTSAQTQVTIDGETQTHNLQFTQPGSISGELSDASSIAIPSGCIKLKHIHSGVGHQGLDISTNSDALGQYSINSAAAGNVIITGLDDCNSPTQATVEQVEVITNTNTTVNLQLGNAVPLSHELNQTGNNYSFEVNATGQVQSKNKDLQYGYNSSFIEPLSLSVNGKDLNRQYAAVIEDANTELTIGPTVYNGLSFSRKTYVPESGLYVRLHDSVTNNTASDHQVLVKVQGYYGTTVYTPTPKARLTVDTTTQGNQYSIQKSTIPDVPVWQTVEIEYIPATTGYVYSDSNNLVPINAAIFDNSNRFSFSWSITLHPGETKSFLSYMMVKAPTSDTTDITVLTTLADELVNGTQVDMYNGLSVDEKTSIANFQVPQ